MTTTAAPAAHTNVNTEHVDCDGHVAHEIGFEEPCGYSGDALVDIIARNGFTITVAWTCPNCKHETVEDRDLRDE